VKMQMDKIDVRRHGENLRRVVRRAQVRRDSEFLRAELKRGSKMTSVSQTIVNLAAMMLGSSLHHNYDLSRVLFWIISPLSLNVADRRGFGGKCCYVFIYKKRKDSTV
jgi:hypothetical protein